MSFQRDSDLCISTLISPLFHVSRARINFSSLKSIYSILFKWLLVGVECIIFKRTRLFSFWLSVWIENPATTIGCLQDKHYVLILPENQYHLNGSSSVVLSYTSSMKRKFSNTRTIKKILKTVMFSILSSDVVMQILTKGFLGK